MPYSYYHITLCIGNLFLIYVINKYLHVFYSECKVKPVCEWFVYIGYFVIITVVDLCIGIPLVIMATNLFMLYLLTFIYAGDWKKASLSVTTIYFSLLCVETIVVILTHNSKLDLFIPSEYQSPFEIIVARLLSYAFVLAVQGFKNVKADCLLPVTYWISLIVVPFGTIVILFANFSSGSVSTEIMFICMVSAFLIKIVTFYLYDSIVGLQVEQMNKKVAYEQEKYQEHQLEMMRSAVNSMKTLRHDLNNKLLPLYDMDILEKARENAEYLSNLMELCQNSGQYVSSGNITFDSIINYKLQTARKENVQIKADIIVPSELPVAAFDIATILGNVLDNALEAVAAVEDRWISIKIKYTKGRLIIEINNSYDGIVKKEKGNIVTRKKNKENHGLELKSVESVLQKYDGAIQVDYDEKKFKVKILLYS